MRGVGNPQKQTKNKYIETLHQGQLPEKTGIEEVQVMK
jgi:hypothetical protein